MDLAHFAEEGIQAPHTAVLPGVCKERFAIQKSDLLFTSTVLGDGDNLSVLNLFENMKSLLD